MASGSGLAFFISQSNRFSQKFSVAAGDIPEHVMGIVEDALETGTKRMTSIINSGGINQTKKGGPRVKSGRMRASVEGVARINGRARVQGRFGFSADAPVWTKWQEKGTQKGPRIAAMLAFTTANREMVENLQDRFDQGDWLNLNL